MSHHLNYLTVCLTLLTFIISVVTCLVRADKQSSRFVWTEFDNNTGWPNGIAFLTGLVTPCFMFGGLDATLHLAEEVENPQRIIPRALISTVSIGFITGFCFSVGMSYTIKDLDTLLSSSYVLCYYPHPLDENKTGGEKNTSLLILWIVDGRFIHFGSRLQKASRQLPHSWWL